ncbi:MAG TPA: LysR family transcriptional regulator [Burkholderiaceae bacterium]|jgi:DNA-binding transcriptional LysR family regulator|nr:LysR family transcriptional regulator [Burkholderiaceae bacterium]
MLDAMSLDQLRTFIAAADEGSFSAAGRKLRRAQSVVSQTLANLEQQIGFALFDRSGRYPRLTEAGAALLADARATASSMDSFKARARTLAEGLEPELSVVVDVMFPIAALTEAVRSFHQQFPRTPLRLYVEALGAVVQPVLDGRCRLGIVGSFPDVPPECTREFLLDVPALLVAAPGHPLALHPAPVPLEEAARHVQLVLTDRSSMTQGRDFNVMSPQVWRLADLGAKLSFLRAGLGWGSMPRHMVEDDLARGTLAPLEIEGGPAFGGGFSMRALYRKDTPPGPAGRWFMARIRQ